MNSHAPTVPLTRRRHPRFGAAAVGLVAAVVAALVGAPGAHAGLPECGTTHWVAAWTADPSGALGAGFADQTLRVVLTPHIAGRLIRVHISNRFAGAPLAVARVTVGRRDSGAALVAGTSTPVSFGGRADVIVPAGAEAVSDPVTLHFAAFDDLAVSLYLAAPTGPSTGHLIGRQRSYATAPSTGDHTGDTTGGAFVESTTSVPYVDAVDVTAPSAVGAVVLFGDSITDGYESAGPSGGEDQSSIDANSRYGDYLARRVIAAQGGPAVSVVNAGISGNRLLAGGLPAAVGPAAADRIPGDVLGTAGVTEAIVLEGINDIFSGASAADVTAALGRVVAALHTAGLRVELGTLVPAGAGLLNVGSLLPAVYVDSPANAARVAVNAWIRSGSSGADGVVDFDAALRGTAQPNELDPAYDSGDHVHPDSAGYSRMAAAVDLATLAGGGCAPATRTSLGIRARVPAAGPLRLTGRLIAAEPTDCSGMQVVVRALHDGRTALLRHLSLTRVCRFATTTAVAVRGMIEVRVGFPGATGLGPARTRSVRVRTT